MKHTQGPWKVDSIERDGTVTTHTVKLGKGRCYFNRSVGQTESEMRANARLIASAPELLDALIRATTHVRSLWEASLQGDHALSSAQIISRRMAAMEALPELDEVIRKAGGS